MTRRVHWLYHMPWWFRCWFNEIRRRANDWEHIAINNGNALMHTQAANADYHAAIVRLQSDLTAALRERAEAREEAKEARRQYAKLTSDGIEWRTWQQRAEAAERERDEAREEIDATWEHIGMAYDCEPREYFEKEAPTNGFKYPLAQAIHHIWKREPKVEAAERTGAALRDENEALKKAARMDTPGSL